MPATVRTYREPARDVKVYDEVDVLVVGAGTPIDTAKASR